MKKLLLEEDLRNWADSPVSESIREALEQELDRVFEERIKSYVPGAPQETQERIVHRLGKEKVLQDMIDILNVSDESGALWGYFGEDCDVVLVKKEK